jgi:hypothetical protein
MMHQRRESATANLVMRSASTPHFANDTMDAFDKINARGRSGCRYIIGDTIDDNWRYCGAAVTDQHKFRSYCLEHYLRCTVPLGKKRSIVELEEAA